MQCGRPEFASRVGSIVETSVGCVWVVGCERWVGAREVSGVFHWPRTDCSGGAARTSCRDTLAAVGAAAGARFPAGCGRAQDYRESSRAQACRAHGQALARRAKMAL